MKALCWHGKGDVRVDTVPDPKIESPRDAVIRVTSPAICGSDLHLFDGYMPTMESGDVLGHELRVKSTRLPSSRTACRFPKRRRGTRCSATRPTGA